MDPATQEIFSEREESEKPEVSQPKKDYKYMGWFLTYPQCPCPKEDCLDDLRDLVKEKRNTTIEEYVVAEEKHADGSPHVHAFIKLGKRIRFKKDLFDIIYEGKVYHGHYEPAKCWTAVEKYCKKEGDYISNLDLAKAKAKKGKMKKEDLLKDVDEVLDEGLITPMQVANFYRNSCVYKMLQNKRKRMPDQMPPKRRHLWVCGESNTGKTSMLRNCMKVWGEDNFFQIPSNNDWIGYDDQYYLYMDEYKGQLSVQLLNRICDGGAKMNVKGGSIQIRYDCQVIILSNYPIDNCYGKCDSVLLDALHNRFIEVKSLGNGEYEIRDEDKAADEDVQKFFGALAEKK